MVFGLQKQYYSILGGSLLFATFLLLTTKNVTDTDSVKENKSRVLLIDEQSKHAKNASEIMSYISNQCREYNIKPKNGGNIEGMMKPWLSPKSFESHRLMYHFNAKTGSTSFKRWLRRIDGDTRPYYNISGAHDNKHFRTWEFIKERNPSIAEEELLSSFYKIGFIRNPLVRFVSGFRDKVLRRTYFEDHLNEVMPGYRNHSGVEIFPVFVEEFLNRQIYDYHFSRQYEKMAICWLPYDMILQTETTLAQIKTVQEHTNTTMFEYPGSRLEVGITTESTDEIAKQYFATLTEDQLERFYQYYQWDFILPGYSKLNDTNFPYLNW